ncbi:MAG: hypothetical protein GX662_13550 [Trichococcus flocculiformis]|uniref:CobQ/CobB/MinD/ParA nucleotide binding domain-containing protein n=1 Tax=Trichococcus flocculiformis TaxID=82803 RepID=A0A847D8V1_9LACT|nr:hypothetical protein [Trichococcus flocculiformis]NLD33259.1 hypothetical protein [Trichococcus flocculiformis]
MFNFPTRPEPLGENKLITFISAGPGAGATTIAALTAMAMKNACIIDLSHTRKVRSYLGVHSEDFTISALDVQHAEDWEVEQYAVKHPSGIKIIPGPVRELDVKLLDAKLSIKILRKAKRTFRNTIIVSSPIWASGWINILMSDVVAYVMRPDRADLDVYHEHMDFISRLDASERLVLVLNQAKKPGSLDLEEVQKVTGKVDYIIPYTEEILRQGNRRRLDPGKHAETLRRIGGVVNAG